MTTPPPPAVRLPPREIQPGVSNWRALGLRLGGPIVVAFGFVLVLNHRSSGLIGAVAALVVTALIFAIEVPLILRSQRKRQAERLRNLPRNAFYACRGTTVVPGRRVRATGNMIFDEDGVTFTPLRNENDRVAIPWSSVTRIELGRSRAQPLARALVLRRVDGTRLTFTVRSWGDLAKVLAAAA